MVGLSLRESLEELFKQESRTEGVHRTKKNHGKLRSQCTE